MFLSARVLTMEKKITKITLEIDVSHLDEDIKPEQIKDIILSYYNVSENHTWQEAVPHKIIKTE
jgi:hypothetical protein